MLTLEDVHEFVYEQCSKVSTSFSGTRFHCRCPLCGDSVISERKKRFHLEYMDDDCRYNCFNCGQSGNFYTLYSLLTGTDKKEAWKKFHTYNYTSIRTKWLKTTKPKEEPKDVQDNFNWIKDHCITIDDTPIGYMQLKYYSILKEFIDDRKITIDVYICLDGRYKHRLIIPIFDNIDIIYFQARSIYDDAENKYLNPVAEKQNIIFNKDKFIKNDPIFVTEGILDAQSINSNGTCSLGKTITDDFLSKIYEYTDDIYIVFDNDKSGYIALSNIIKTSEYSTKLKYFLMPKIFCDHKDINNIIVKSKLKNIDKFIIENSFSREMTKVKLIMDKWRYK